MCSHQLVCSGLLVDQLLFFLFLLLALLSQMSSLGLEEEDSGMGSSAHHYPIIEFPQVIVIRFFFMFLRSFSEIFIKTEVLTERVLCSVGNRQMR